MKSGLLLFIKYPRPGKVKTRLAATVGAEAAAEIYLRLVAEVCARLPLGADVIVMFDPPESGAQVEEWLAPMLGSRVVRYRAQANGNLGLRLSDAFAGAFGEGFERLLAIGSDCIELDAAIFSQAWESLERFDVVIGPTVDGGYYLLGLRAPCPTLFGQIDWGTDAVFAQTLERVMQAGLRVDLLPILNDIDTETDWRRAKMQLAPFSETSALPR